MLTKANSMNEPSEASNQELPYVMPEDVRGKLANASVVAPVCCKLIEKISDPKTDFKSRMTNVDNILKDFVNKLKFKHLYTLVADCLIWTRSLETVMTRRNIDQSHINWMNKQLLQAHDARVKKMIEEKTLDEQKEMEAQVSQLDKRMECFEDIFEAVFLTKAYFEFFGSLCTQLMFDHFANFVFMKIEDETHRVFLWLFKTKLFEVIEDFPVNLLVYYAITKNETGMLYEICQVDDSQQMAADVVDYLNTVAGSFFQRFDPECIALPSTNEVEGLKRHEKEVLNIAFNYRKRFKLDISKVNNCTFVRQIKAFINTYNIFEKGDHKEREGFHQKAFHIMSEGGRRIQIAILKFLCSRRDFENAVTMALKMDVPKDDWLPDMTSSSKFIKTIKENIAKQNEIIFKEQEEIRDGFNLLHPGSHMVNLIDSREAIRHLLKPFIRISDNTFFGIDAEWDMSYSGDMGTVCLIQMSSATQTMLIDIHTLRKVHKWSDRRFLKKLFTLIFDHNKKIYGFALDSDMMTIANNFPLFGTELLPKLTNLVCLHVAAKTICSDVDLCNAVFGEEPPDDLNLSALTRRLIRFNLDKKEQVSIWCCRPLRKTQQFYAAKDSYAVVKLKTVITESIEKECPDKLDLAFVPWKMNFNLADDADDQSQLFRKPGFKTKSSHVSDEELKSVIKKVNEKLEATEFTKLDAFYYITDTMCAPLGACLRRIGISASPGSDEDNVAQQAINKSGSKILTTGKACKKYPFGDRVKDVKIALSLDEQLADLLYREKICIDPDNLKPRCLKCNALEMVYLPELCIRFIHYKMALSKNIESADIDFSNILDLQKELESMDPREDSAHYCFIQEFDQQLCAVLPNAIINLEELYMLHLEDGAIVDPENAIKLHPAMHLLGKGTYDKNRLYAICFECGKENPDCAIAIN